MKNDFCMRHLLFFFIACMMMLLYACNSADEVPVEKRSAYYPIYVGHYWTYQVSEVRFSSVEDVTLNYQQKITVIDSAINQVGETIYAMHISQRESDADAWAYKETWSVRISSLNEIIVSEENVPYVSLIFPVRDAQTWNGNKYNASGVDGNETSTFKIVDFQKPYENFSNTITVEEANELNFVFKDRRYSIYAKNTGLVYRINSHINYCNDQSETDDCFGLFIIDSEQTKIETLLEHGVQ